MSNDKKTLADAQPGGRVRLGEQAERARFEAWVSGKGIGIDRWKNGAYMSRYVQEKWEIWQAALSAQPSPGGQDALASARELLAAEYDKAGEKVFADRARKGLYDNDPDVRAIVAALAAHQPVRIYGCCAQPEGELHTAECPNLRHLAARQPVGEPVGAAQPGKRVGILEAACGPDRKFDPAAADAELASIPLVPLWDLPELHPRNVADECLTTMEQVRQGTKPHTSRRHKLTEAIALTKRFIEQQERSERLGTAPPAQAVDLGPSQSVLAEVAQERARQEAKWGQQNHVDWTPTSAATDLAGAWPAGVGDHFKFITDYKAKGAEGHRLGYFDILMEEVAEAHDEARDGNTKATRAELVQVAAVAVAWIECIDRRLTVADSQAVQS